mgnify:CR=1 FL=1|jgi:hypothetical protein
MTKKFKVGQKVILNCKSFVPKNTLDDDGWFPVEGTITGFTEKRIKAINQVRDTEGLYKPENVKELNKGG